MMSVMSFRTHWYAYDYIGEDILFFYQRFHKADMKKIGFFILIFLHLFLQTIQLSCSRIQVKYSEPFIEPPTDPSCLNTTSMKIFKGQILAYYLGNHPPEYINYTLGTIGDTLERKYENDIITHGLSHLTKYQVILNAKNEETLIVADIYCTISNDCALLEIKKLFFKYNHQLNPFEEFKSLIYIDPPPKKLHCFDISIGQSQVCVITDSPPVCLSYSKDLKQECSIESDVHIHEEFLLTSPEQVQFSLMNELVRCNRDNCNDIEILTKIQKISRDYAYGNVIQTNKTNELQGNVSQILMILFCFFSKLIIG